MAVNALNVMVMEQQYMSSSDVNTKKIKVGDKVFLIYDANATFREISAFQVEILTPLQKSDKFSRGQIVCRAHYLKKFTFGEGWGPYVNPRGDVYRVNKKNLYTTWDDALQVLKKNMSFIINVRKADAHRANQEIEQRKRNLEAYELETEQLQFKTSNIAKSFALIEDNYISPFTGEQQ